MSKRTCYKCGQPEGSGKHELRPYGEGGKDLCAGCMFGGKNGKPDPELEEEARRQLLKRFMEPGPHILDPKEQVGPRPMKSKGKS